MGFFDCFKRKLKNKEEPLKIKYEVRKYKLEFVQEEFDTGKTTVQLTFKDGTKFKTIFHGSINQSCHEGHDQVKNGFLREPSAEIPRINSSEFQAQNFISNLSLVPYNYYNEYVYSNHFDSTHYNYSLYNSNGVTETHLGEVVHTKILKTIPYKELHRVAKVVPK